MLSFSDEFLGATSTSRLDFTPPLKDPARISLSCLAAAACSTPQALTAPQGYVSPSASQGAFSPIYTSDVTPSLSSDSVSLPTQLEAQLSPTPTPAPAPTSPQPLVQELSLRLSEASLEEVEESPEEQQQQQQQTGGEQQTGVEQQQTGGEQQSAPLPEVVTDGPIPEEEPPAAPTTRTETNREDGPQDLRVFELNSDSGKSTPSNNGKKGEQRDYCYFIAVCNGTE